MIFRYVDIFLGGLLLAAHICLLHGSHQKNRLTLILFLSLSLTSLSLYWIWFAYLKYALQDSEATKEVSSPPLITSECLHFYVSGLRSWKCHELTLPNTSTAYLAVL